MVYLHKLLRYLATSLLLVPFSSAIAAQPSGTAAPPPQIAQPAATTTQANVSSKAIRKADVGTASAISVRYAYDSLGRLIQETYPANSSDYTYDPAGNRTQAQTR